MEPWSYVSGVKNLVSDESVSETDGIAGVKNGFMGWGLKPSSSYGSSSVLCSDQDGIRSQELDDLGSSDLMKNSLPNGSIGDALNSKFAFRRLGSQLPASGEEDSSSKLSSSIVESNSRDSSIIDLKLGRFPDHKDAQVKANVNFSRAESSMPAKKARVGSLSSQRSYCQVHGCRKDLSSSKDYHKRHKVCEIHSKTTKVIVNGIEQRFCQQCSRFHLLAEFDDGKRSCRKRLAGHNERRRKPHIGLPAGRAGRVLQSYNATAGTTFQGTSSVLSSFVCQDILPGSSLVVHPQKYELNGWYRNVKVEDGADYGPEPEPAIPNPKPKVHTHIKSHMSSFGSDKQFSPSQDDGLNAMTRAKTNQKNHPFMHNVSASDFDSHPVFHNTNTGMIGSEDLTVLDSSSAVQGLPAVSSYGCALSLLSSQSPSSSNHSSAIPTAFPLIITPSSHALMRVSPPQTSTTGVPNTFRSSAETTHIEPILISTGIDSVNYGISRIIPGSGYMNGKNQLSCEDGSTVDLLQLSSQLQRVEHQRQSMKVKEENDAFFGLRIT